MAMRYSRRRADGLVEYSDSKEQLAASASQESEDSRQGCFALVGLVLGALVTLIFLHAHAMGLPRFVRLLLIIAAGVGCAFVLAGSATWIARLFWFAVGLAVLTGIGLLIWRAL